MTARISLIRQSPERRALIVRLSGDTAAVPDFIAACRDLYAAYREGTTSPELDQLRDLVRRSWLSTAEGQVGALDTTLGWVVQQELEDRQPEMTEHPCPFGISGVFNVIEWMRTDLGLDPADLASGAEGEETEDEAAPVAG